LRLLHVVGARPNFPKLAPVYRAAKLSGAQQIIIHTGQHYDDQLSGAFFRDLGIPAPDVNLLVGSETHALQTARIMERIEPLMLSHRPDWVLVYGDVNSTMAAALVAVKLGIRIAHVEAGLRSYDRTMPEEINRIVTDRLADLLLTPSRDANEILRSEGEPDEEIVFVGNVMIDSLYYALRSVSAWVWGPMPSWSPCTVLRTSMTQIDCGRSLPRSARSRKNDPWCSPYIRALVSGSSRRESVWATSSPSSRYPISRCSISCPAHTLDLVSGAYAVITDSGGLQEETTALGIPCLTVRENTERPITLTEGTNQLAPDPVDLPELVRGLVRSSQPRQPDGWDGKASERIVHALATRTVRERTSGTSHFRLSAPGGARHEISALAR
jgi:UDP-N-acetylglucosamine 2-epimerase (non-hydrolysing)